jgi:hypothetical protein
VASSLLKVAIIAYSAVMLVQARPDTRAAVEKFLESRKLRLGRFWRSKAPEEVAETMVKRWIEGRFGAGTVGQVAAVVKWVVDYLKPKANWSKVPTYVKEIYAAVFTPKNQTKRLVD